MSQEKLREASDVLREASESTEGEASERLRTQADALAELADATRGPDHGRVARHQQKLREIEATASEVGDGIDRANALLDEYRETVEGV
jgi:hypothetical protein